MTKFDEMIKKELESLHGDFLDAMGILEDNDYHEAAIYCTSFYDGSHVEVEYHYRGDEETDCRSLCLYLFFTKEVHDWCWSEDDEDQENYDEVADYADNGDWDSLSAYIEAYSAIFQPEDDEDEQVFMIMDDKEFVKHCKLF